MITPSSHWHEAGEPDPHAGRYDEERYQLTLGTMTDDELANGAYLNYDNRPSLVDMLNPKPGQYMPIVWMTAVKDRIRWLSRALERSEAALAAASAKPAIQGEPVYWEYRHLDTANTPNEWSEWARCEPRNPYTETAKDKAREIQGYIDAGYKYELRALYASPQASPDGGAEAQQAAPQQSVSAEAIKVKQRLMKMAREVGGLNWADRMCIGQAIALIDGPSPQAEEKPQGEALATDCDVICATCGERYGHHYGPFCDHSEEERLFGNRAFVPAKRATPLSAQVQPAEQVGEPANRNCKTCKGLGYTDAGDPETGATHLDYPCPDCAQVTQLDEMSRKAGYPARPPFLQAVYRALASPAPQPVSADTARLLQRAREWVDLGGYRDYLGVPDGYKNRDRARALLKEIDAALSPQQAEGSKP